MHLALEVWREVGRNAELAESVPRISELLSARFPFDLLLLRRIDPQAPRLETVALGSRHPLTPPAARRELTHPELLRIATWCQQGRLLRSESREDAPLLSTMVPQGVGGEILAGPLVGPEGPLGLVLLARSRHPFTPEQERLVQTLLEPLTVALANARHLHDMERLREAVEADRRALLSRLERQDIADSVVGSDSGLRTVTERVEQVAPTDVPVLLLGETGTGKEVIARRIHTRSRRAEGPMVRVNCGAIPPELIDSELFGHERGSFTGAVATRKGWFERADGGTLFLDEIGELPPAVQVRLLRILQDGALERVGGQRTLAVDVRVVAATSRDLPDMVSRGTFRQDLWYRISVFPIPLPPLRDRVEDIPALAAHFAWRAGKRLGFAPLAPSPEDIDLLVSYSWPGNVRELAAVIERAAILGDGRRLEVAAALGVGGGQAFVPVGVPAPSRSAPGREMAIQTLDEAMTHHIRKALAATKGRVEGPHGAAALLAINPHTLRARMRKLGVDWRPFRHGESAGL